MSDAVRVFVNEQVVVVAPGATVWEAVLALDPALSTALRQGRAYVTDGVGRRIESGGSVEPGAILRVVLSARHPAGE